MKETRRDFLETATALSALAVGVSGTASAADCSGVGAWQSDTAYLGGDQVTYDGALWTAEWWTRDSEPAESKAVWTREGPCGSGSGSGGTDDGGTGACAGVPAYQSGATYTGGDQVTYDGALWTAEWWTRGTAPAESEYVWTLEGTCDGSGTSPNEGPTASFTVSSTAPTVGESITLDASGSTDADGSIASHAWDFGDGTTVNAASGTQSYDSAGEYTITLTVTDDDGATATATQTVSVASGNTNGAPMAEFVTSPSEPAVGESVTFDAADSSDPDGDALSYEWDFGDGTTASGQSGTHSYSSAGEYTATLTVADGNGASDSASMTVTVGDTGGGSTGATEFAPYNYIFTDPSTSMVDHAQQAGNEGFTAAFVLSDGSGNAAWGGEVDQMVGEAGLQSEFQAFQDTGGTIVISFGGAVGTMIAQDTNDVEKIKSEYRKIMDTYGVDHLDFDIESVDQAAVDRRNQALAELQSERPELKVSYTLRSRTTGLTSHGTYVVESARDNGVDLQYVNVMTMNYGWVRPSASTVKDTANGTHDDLMSLLDVSSEEAWGMVGVTPMLGENNVGGEHTLADAREVADFAQNKGVGLVSFWSIDRDNGSCPDGTVSGSCSGIAQNLYEFSQIYSEVQ